MRKHVGSLRRPTWESFQTHHSTYCAKLHKDKRKYWWSKSRNKSVWIKPKERSSGGSFKVREKKASSADNVEKMESVEVGEKGNTISESHASTNEGQSMSKEEQVHQDEDDGDC